MGEPRGIPCHKLPFPIYSCPWCGSGIKVTRAVRMVEAKALLHHLTECQEDCKLNHPGGNCPLKVPTQLGQVGLLGVGVKYYPTVEDFARECDEQGICKRIPRLPRGFKVGETWVFLSHPKACVESTVKEEQPVANRKSLVVPEMLERKDRPDADKLFREVPGVFKVFKPRLEYVSDGTETDEKLDRMRKAGTKIVEVPADDPDHH